MPTRKQRRREAKEKRHDYEFVYVDSEGHEVEVPEEETPAAKPAKSDDRRNGSGPAAQQQKGKAPQKGGRQARVPQAPSWQRATKRAALLGIIVFILFSFTASRSHAGWVAALLPAVIYTALFIPFTYWLDRYAYNRYMAKQQQQSGTAAKKQPPKKR
ncbi:MAG TPA: hypothetical protein VMT74_05765 [Gaiellaceae bacterium]|nr:hypothetical protein [Gaiellaceae bacterium]